MIKKIIIGTKINQYKLCFLIVRIINLQHSFIKEKTICGQLSLFSVQVFSFIFLIRSTRNYFLFALPLYSMDDEKQRSTHLFGSHSEHCFTIDRRFLCCLVSS